MLQKMDDELREKLDILTSMIMQEIEIAYPETNRPGKLGILKGISNKGAIIAFFCPSDPKTAVDFMEIMFAKVHTTLISGGN